MKNRKGRWTALLAVALALFVITGISISTAAENKISSNEISSIIDTTTDQTQITSPLITVANAARESVVGVSNYQVGGRRYYGFGFGYNEPSETEYLAGTGSGVVVTAYGHVLTNYHVVEHASRVTVTNGDKELKAEIVGTDSNLDIAVLMVPGLNLPAIPLGDSDALQIGEWAIVIGNPLGQEFERTVTVGIVSALDRTVTDRSLDRYGRRTTVTNSMIQVDAAINQGNSGGGLFNILGQLQGIPARKYSSNSFFSGTTIDNIGMCIPINVAKPLLQSVLENFNKDAEAAAAAQPDSKEAPRPRIGVTVATLSSGFSLVRDGTLPAGAYVQNVEKGSPAEAAGIHPGDILVEVDGTIVQNSTMLVNKLQSYSEGDTAKVKLFRLDGLFEAIENDTPFDKLGDGSYLDVEVELVILDALDM